MRTWRADVFLTSSLLNVFMVGVGLIGSTLINQIKAQAAYLSKERSLEINITGLANSRQMHFNEEGIDLENWKDTLLSCKTTMTMEAYIDKMIELNLTDFFTLIYTQGGFIWIPRDSYSQPGFCSNFIIFL